jgi:hypothetical protein
MPRCTSRPSYELGKGLGCARSITLTRQSISFNHLLRGALLLLTERTMVRSRSLGLFTLWHVIGPKFGGMGDILSIGFFIKNPILYKEV